MDVPEGIWYHSTSAVFFAVQQSELKKNEVRVFRGGVSSVPKFTNEMLMAGKRSI